MTDKTKAIVTVIRKELDNYSSDAATDENGLFTLTREQLEDIAEALEECEPSRPIGRW